jgi:hypothetical protein
VTGLYKNSADSKRNSNPYTSLKLNLLKAARFDRTISDFDYRVLSGLAEHILRDGTARVPDETLATEIGCRWRQSIARSRRQLSKRGYVSWRRTQKESVYTFNFAKAEAVIAMMNALKQSRSRCNPPRTSDETLGFQNPVKDSVKERESTKKREVSRATAPDRRLPLMRVVQGERAAVANGRAR